MKRGTKLIMTMRPANQAWSFLSRTGETRRQR